MPCFTMAAAIPENQRVGNLFTQVLSTTALAVPMPVHCLIKGHIICYHAFMIKYVKAPQLSVIRVRHCVPVAGFCLSLNSLHVLNGPLYDAIKIKKIHFRHMSVSATAVYLILPGT